MPYKYYASTERPEVEAVSKEEQPPKYGDVGELSEERRAVRLSKPISSDYPMQATWNGGGCRDSYWSWTLLGGEAPLEELPTSSRPLSSCDSVELIYY